MNPVLAAKDLIVSRGSRRILQNLAFEIVSGTLAGLIGPNGSGKTTLLRTISGYWPYQGSIQVHEREISSWSSRALARRLAVVRQAPTLSFDFTVAEIVLLGLLPHKSVLQDYSKSDFERVQSILGRLELDGFERRKMHTLSGGEQQRVYLAQALIQDAELLLLDEPTTHLDVHSQYAFLNEARKLQQQGRTILVVFHDLELAARFADHLLVLSEGRLVAAGPPRSILSESLIQDVFKMQASLYNNEHGELGITYLSAANGGKLHLN